MQFFYVFQETLKLSIAEMSIAEISFANEYCWNGSFFLKKKQQ